MKVIPMAWKKPNKELTEFLEEKMASFDCQKKMMFGSQVYFVNNNMMSGVHQDDIFIRLSEQDKEDIFSSYDEASPFEPMKGRTMKQYAVLPESLYNDPEKLDEWLTRSYNYVSSMPLKEPKKKKSKTKAKAK